MPKRRLIYATLLIFAAAGLERVYHYQNGGFHISKVLSDLPSQSVPLPPDILQLLDQPFHFFGKGGTSYAFLGEDGKTVLKLFNHRHLFFKSLWLRTPLPGIADGMRIRRLLAIQKKEAHKRAPFFFNSCQLAMEELQAETGLLYLCLKPNPQVQVRVTLIDAWGISHSLDLCRTEFALQQKAELLFPHLEKLLANNLRDELKKSLDALISQIQRRCSKGIGDRDPNLMINFGYVGSRAVEFDLGSYFSNPALKNPPAMAREIFFATYLLQKWLKQHCPELLDDFLAKAGGAT